MDEASTWLAPSMARDSQAKMNSSFGIAGKDSLRGFPHLTGDMYGPTKIGPGGYIQDVGGPIPR